MNRPKLHRLIETVDKADVLNFNFGFIRKGNCGCALGVAAELFWGETDDILATPEPFKRIMKELDLTTEESDVLFNYPAEYKVETNKGVVYGFGYRDEEDSVFHFDEELPTKEEWVTQARELMRITE